MSSKELPTFDHWLCDLHSAPADWLFTLPHCLQRNHLPLITGSVICTLHQLTGCLYYHTVFRGIAYDHRLCNLHQLTGCSRYCILSSEEIPTFDHRLFCTLHQPTGHSHNCIVSSEETPTSDHRLCTLHEEVCCFCQTRNVCEQCLQSAVTGVKVVRVVRADGGIAFSPLCETDVYLHLQALKAPSYQSKVDTGI